MNKNNKTIGLFINIVIKIMILVFFYYMALDFIETLKVFIENIFTLKNQVILLAIALYALSLALPAFGFYEPPINSGKGSTRAEKGYVILLFGTLLGWASVIFKGNYGAIAVYANYLFFYTAISLMDKPSLIVMITSVAMIMLALQSFYYRNSGGEISSPLGERVQIWGWGAVFWFYAQFVVLTLTLSLFSTLPIMPIWSYIILLFVFSSGLMVYQKNKYAKANKFEKRAYFPKWATCTMHKLSGYVYHPPKDVAINENTVIKLGEDIRLKQTNLTVSIGNTRVATPKQFIYEDKFYKVFNLMRRGYDPIAEILPAKPYDLQYTVHFDKGKLTYALTDNKGDCIWTAETRIGKKEGIPPKYDSDLYELFSPLSIQNKYDVWSASFLNKSIESIRFDFAKFDDFGFLADKDNPKSFFLMQHKFYYYDFDVNFLNEIDEEIPNNRYFGLGLRFWHTDDLLVLSNSHIRLVQERDSEIAIVFFALMFDKKTLEPLFKLKLDNGSANMRFEKGLLEKLGVMKENKLVQKQTLLKELFESTDRLKVKGVRFGMVGREKQGLRLIELQDTEDMADFYAAPVLETAIGDFPLWIS